MAPRIATRHSPDAKILGPLHAEAGTILTPEALAFVANLTRRYGNRIRMALARRVVQRVGISNGEPLDFPSETEEIRRSAWRAAELPSDLRKRLVEITGPVDRKMVITALNSGADTFVADFENASTPTWHNMIWGQINLRDAVRRTIRYRDLRTRRRLRLNTYPATLLVRPRGFYLCERNVEVDGSPVPAALLDFGLYVFHNARALIRRGSGPYFYLPKLECYREARLWNDIFVHTEELLEIPPGTIRAAVSIETLQAAFQMDEILYELRDHSAGLSCGRSDYIFSFIKTQRHDPAAVLPDRSQVTMSQPFLQAYSQLAVKTCHRRGVHCIGGMAADIPNGQDPATNGETLARVRADKLREVQGGHDGTWVAHPGLVPVAREVFATRVNGAGNLIDVQLDQVEVTAADLLAVPHGTRTEDGLRGNAQLGIRYLESWLRGVGRVPLYHQMEDAATAEVCRTQIWQWLRHGANLDDGRPINPELVERIFDEEMRGIESEVGASRFRSGRFADARQLLDRLCDPDAFEEFFTLPGTELL